MWRRHNDWQSTNFTIENLLIEENFLDLAVTNSGSDNVSIFLGTGTGAFGPPNIFSVGSGPASIAVGDVN